MTDPFASKRDPAKIDGPDGLTPLQVAMIKLCAEHRLFDPHCGTVLRLTLLETFENDPRFVDLDVEAQLDEIAGVFLGEGDHPTPTVHALRLTRVGRDIEIFTERYLELLRQRLRDPSAGGLFSNGQVRQLTVDTQLASFAKQPLAVIVNTLGVGSWQGDAFALPESAELAKLRKLKTFGEFIGLRQEETRAQLERSAPKPPPAPPPAPSPPSDTERSARFEAREFHPLVVTSAKSLFVSTHAEDAVRKAALAFQGEVVRIIGLAIDDGDHLMNRAFSPDRPLIKLTPCETKTEKSIQQGAMFFAKGLVAVIRNPAMHVGGAVSDEEALEQLAVVSLMYRLLEKRISP